ncbi:hypothetical protein PC9H_010149 [Pleurotus ostreatus]|uniref:Uncharacterized protein n=1 Tax=Pleurotus ostreatus TaxID=5322 RepID=A0A8H6ZN87_PLEOS|nr:uncharacterized protein PC9H_010149 [Pleurotus ostreatus]KAF7424838.1 hypothetical protein PC9H_010149 [Pleurotus ostreatus]KAJ8692148.1 hypothetical protein PTI98_009486 [Pleurotus ostreatus]
MSFTLARSPVPVISAQMEFTRDILEAWKEENNGGQRKNQRPRRDASGSGSNIETSSNDGTNDRGAQGKIPKPIGEPGRRPETGGFPLKERLLKVEMWEEETYDDILNAVRKASQVALNLSVSFKFQDKTKVDMICAKMARKWNFLDEYDGHWPVKSMLKAYLKYTSERARKDNKDAAEELERDVE